MTLALLAGLAACGGGDSSPTRPVVAVPVATVTVTPTIREVRVGETVVLHAQAKDVSGNVLDRTVTWTSSSTAIATVTSAGQVAAVGPGQAIITATSETQSGTATINVPFPVASIEFDSPPEFVQIGQTVFVRARAVSSNGTTLQRPITYSTSNLAVLGVSGSGQVTGLAPGTAVITATAEGKSKDVTITATPVATVSITHPSYFLPRNADVQLTAVSRDVLNTVVTGNSQAWSWTALLAGSTATVSNTGLFRASTNGAGRVTATVDGISATQEFEIYPALLHNDPWPDIEAQTDQAFGWVLAVPPPPSRVVVTITGPNGDADLYVVKPTLVSDVTQWELLCGATIDDVTSNQTCDRQDLPAGYYFVLVDAFSSFTDVELKVMITTPGAPAARVQSLGPRQVMRFVTPMTGVGFRR